MKVKIIKHCCVPFKGHDYTQADGEFELPDGIAQKLIDGGTCAEVESTSLDDSEDVVDDNEKPELLFLLPSNQRWLVAVLEEAGYTTVHNILDANVDDLVQLRGIGLKTAEALKSEALAFVIED